MGKLISLDDYRKKIRNKDDYSNIDLIIDTIINRLTYYEYKELIKNNKKENKKE